MGDRREQRRRVVPLIAIAVAVGCLAVGLILLAVDVLPAATTGLRGQQRASEIDRARTEFVALLGVILASVGVAFTARTYLLNRRGQVTDRFIRAVEQLGNDAPDVQLGGIYALEQVALESPRDHRSIMEILVAYVQQHARLTKPLDPANTANPRDNDRPRPSADVRGALMVIGRRRTKFDNGFRLDLPRTDLRGLRLRGDEANLSGARLRYANLRGAHLEYSYLEKAELRGAVLVGADLKGCHLNRARLVGAKLKGVDLRSQT